jgi:hypothetical protein
VGIFIAAYLAHAARVAFAAGAMIAVGGALWLVVGMLTALAGIQSGNVVLASMAGIALVSIAAGSFISVRYITPNAVLHPVLAAMSIALLFVSLALSGDTGAVPILVLVGAGAIAAISAFTSRSSKAPPNTSLERTRDR